jgi:transposase-like protein
MAEPADPSPIGTVTLVSVGELGGFVGVSTATPSYKGHRYPVEIINDCVWLYFRFPLSFREVEELMLVRGVAVSYETIRRWCAKFGQAYANQLRRRRPRPGDRWHLDEVFVGINGRLRYLNNLAENSHQRTRQRERAMTRFTSSRHAQRFLSAFSGISAQFRPRRHLLTATQWRTEMADRFAVWRQVTAPDAAA